MIELRKSHLRVITGALINVGSGLLLSIFTIRDPGVLTAVMIFAILSFRLASDLEEVR